METQTIKTLANIRTDVVGSLLRPDHLKQAYAQRDQAKLGADELRRIEDEAIREAVRLQEGIGLDVITDGEFRRLNFQDSFATSVSGFDARATDLSFVESLSREGKPLQRWDPYHVAEGAAILQRRPVSQKLRLVRNLPLEEYSFVSGVARQPVKVTLVGPDRIVQRFDYQKSKSVYWSTEDFVTDVVRIEREMIRSLIDAGCRYVQIDAPSYTAYVDAPSLDEMKQRGEDPMKNLMRSIQADNEILRLFDGVTFGIHLCRGNQRSMWHREGSYDAIAEKLFNELATTAFYSSMTARGQEPSSLCALCRRARSWFWDWSAPKSPKSRRSTISSAASSRSMQVYSLDQLAISPQCGFASDVVGNLISEDDQKRKLEVVVETARQVWG